MNQVSHEPFMQRALDLAQNAPHRASPNPMVGCVIAKDGVIIGEGITQRPGQAHAEVMALRAAGESARGADMYVTLEPCCHVGRTGPCTRAIIDAGIKRVFAGFIDPNPLVHGQGLNELRAAGIDVHTEVLAASCHRHHAPFAKFIRERRPWVLLKAATSLDGRIATMSGDSKWLTGEEARADVHRLRARNDAIIVGAETARLDNPRLTVRHVDGSDPLRVVLDVEGTLKPDLPTLGEGSLLICGASASEAAITAHEAQGTEVACVGESAAGVDLGDVLDLLYSKQVVSLMVEGGGRLHGSFIAAGLADELCLYVSPRILGAGRPVFAIPSVETVEAGWTMDEVHVTQLGADARITGVLVYPTDTVDANS